MDLNGLSDGSHTLELKYSLPTGVQVKNKIKIKVKLKRQEGEVTDAPSTPTPTVEYKLKKSRWTAKEQLPGFFLYFLQWDISVFFMNYINRAFICKH